MSEPIEPGTKLPWYIHRTFKNMILTGGNTFEVGSPVTPPGDQDAAYIVHACNSYPQLVAEVRKLRKWTKLKDDLLKKQVSELKRQDDKLAELENPCVWTPHVSGTFFTSCGDKWNTSAWDINKSILPDYYKHCPYCGHPITEEPTDGR